MTASSSPPDRTVPRPAGEVVGQVAGLQRYPVKSARGEVLQRADVDDDGLREDRRWVLHRPDGRPITARQVPGLRDLTARVVDGRAQVDPSAGDLVGPYELVEATGRGHEVAAVHLVSAGAAAAPDAPAGADPDPRANVFLDLPAPGRERQWVGRRLRLGSVVLGVTRPPSGCLGVYAEVLTAGALAVGDDVVLLPEADT